MAMDVLKLAFETVIIGLFALPWLWVMIDLVKPDLFESSRITRLMELIPQEMRAPVLGLALFSLVYLLGSMIAPVSSEFLNDKDMLGGFLPTEEKIQAWAYVQGGGSPISVLAASNVNKASLKYNDVHSAAEVEDARCHAIHQEFQREESALLSRGTDKCERINRLHEQLTVLRGATFSAFALMVLCGFAWCTRCTKTQDGASQDGAIDNVPFWLQTRRLGAFLLALAVISLAVRELMADLHNPEVGDMPVAELVLLVLGGLGMYIAIRGARSRFHFHALAFVFSLCFMFLCYSGYGCTESSYDQTVFSTYRAVAPPATANTPMTGSISE